jgi:hypothetical protein
LNDRLDACEEDLRGRLEPDERVIAVGRAEDITLRGDIDAGGAGWTFVMVTDRHLRWVPDRRLQHATSVDLDDVTEALDQTSAHRYAITLHHAKTRALRNVPAHRFLWFRWGNAEAVRALGTTRLAFSRRDTDAAAALRGQLAHRGIVPKTIPSPQRRRPDRRAYQVLRSEDQ